MKLKNPSIVSALCVHAYVQKYSSAESMDILTESVLRRLYKKRYEIEENELEKLTPLLIKAIVMVIVDNLIYSNLTLEMEELLIDELDVLDKNVADDIRSQRIEDATEEKKAHLSNLNTWRERNKLLQENAIKIATEKLGEYRAKTRTYDEGAS